MEISVGEPPNKQIDTVDIPLARTPVLDSWFMAYKLANTRHPQGNFGIQTLTGNAITHSLRDGTVDLSYFGKSAFTPDQIEDLAGTVERVHRKHKITSMPEGHERPGEKTFYINKIRNLWGITVNDTIRSVAHFVIGTESATPLGKALLERVEQRAFLNSTANDIFLLQSLSTKKEFEEKLPIITDLYQAATDVLATDEAMNLAKERLHSAKMLAENPDAKPLYLDQKDIERRRVFAGMIKQAVENKALNYGIPERVITQFIYDITDFKAGAKI